MICGKLDCCIVFVEIWFKFILLEINNNNIIVERKLLFGF